MNRSSLLRGYLAATATLVMWTGFSLVSRAGGKSVLTPEDVFALRLMVAATVLLPFAGSLPTGFWKDRRLWTLSVTGGLLYGLLVYRGFKYAPAAHGAILLSGLQPFLISALFWIIDGFRPTRIKLWGLAAIAAGMVCAAVPYFNDFSADALFGDILLFLSSLTWAYYSVQTRRWGYPAWTLTRCVALGSALIYLPIYALWLPKNLHAAPLSMIVLQGLFQGVGATIFAMLLYLKAVSYLGAERTAAYLALVPIVTGLLAVPLLDEALSGWLLSGLVMVSFGAWIASRHWDSQATLKT